MKTAEITVASALAVAVLQTLFPIVDRAIELSGVLVITVLSGGISYLVSPSRNPEERSGRAFQVASLGAIAAIGLYLLIMAAAFLLIPLIWAWDERSQ